MPTTIISPDGNTATVSSLGAMATQGGYTNRVRATYIRAADATVYAAGDLIGNSTTAANVVPIQFPAARFAGGSGRITGCRCVISTTAATVVFPAFDLLLFRPDPVGTIPFVDGAYPADNAVLIVSAAPMAELTGVLSFVSTGWRNQSGGATAVGQCAYQACGFTARPYAPFALSNVGVNYVIGLMQVQNAWTPGNFPVQFDFALDVDQD